MAPTLDDRFGPGTARLESSSVETIFDDPAEVAEGLTVTQATELLDWLEGHGIRSHDVRLEETGRMTVVWVG